MQENPITSEKGEDFKKEVLIRLGEDLMFKKINDEEVTQEDVRDAATEK